MLKNDENRSFLRFSVRKCEVRTLGCGKRKCQHLRVPQIKSSPYSKYVGQRARRFATATPGFFEYSLYNR